MNFVHAFGFLVVGVISGLLPRWFPGLCAATGVDGSSTREIWLQIMSAVQVGIAGVYFLQRVGSWLGTVMPYTYTAPQAGASVRAPLPATPVAASAGRSTAPADGLRHRNVLPLPVAGFQNGLLEQRRAA